MQRVVIADTPNYRLTGHGNGLAYNLFHKVVGVGEWYQGDDAARFREDLAALEEADPERPTDDILRVLWLQGADHG